MSLSIFLDCAQSFGATYPLISDQLLRSSLRLGFFGGFVLGLGTVLG